MIRKAITTCLRGIVAIIQPGMRAGVVEHHPDPKAPENLFFFSPGCPKNWPFGNIDLHPFNNGLLLNAVTQAKYQE